MRIVLFSGLDERTPPEKYGSVETLAYCAARELTELGHHVVVYATEDSADTLRFCEFRPYPLITRGIRHIKLDQDDADELKLQVTRQALREAVTLDADVIHNNSHTGLLAWSELLRKPKMVTTAHWPFDCSVIGPAFEQARGHHVITVSRAQQSHARSLHFDLQYCNVVYNCIAHERFFVAQAYEKTDRLAWVGRFDPMKGVEESIAIARLLGRQIDIAGKVDNYAKPYFDTVVKPLIQANRGLVEFHGEVSQLEASRIMASAHAFLMTTRYHESFGLVVAEALAVGTRVVATAMGAMPELIHNGENGFVVPMKGKNNEIDIRGFAAAVEICGNISPDACRASAEQFRPARMAQDYADVYASIVEAQYAQRRFPV